MKSRTRQSAPLRRAVTEALAALGHPGLAIEARIMAGWPRIVGAQVASRSLPYSLRGGVLTVAVCNSVWMTQLGFLRGEMARKVNAFLGETAVSGIRLTLERKSDWWPSPPAQAAPTASSLLPEEEALIGEACAQIADGELRDGVRRVLERQAHLARRR